MKNCEVRACGDVLCPDTAPHRCQVSHSAHQASGHSPTQRTRTTQRKHFTGCSLWGRPTHAARSRALSAPSTAVACGRPRRGAVAALVPRWSHDDDHLPGGRVTRALPPPANGHGRSAWCERRNRTAGGRRGPRLPGQPASRLHLHALVSAAFDNFGSDRRGLRARHADTHVQSNTHGARGLKVRRSPSIGRASRTLGPHRGAAKLHPRPKYIMYIHRTLQNTSNPSPN